MGSAINDPSWPGSGRSSASTRTLTPERVRVRRAGRRSNRTPLPRMLPGVAPTWPATGARSIATRRGWGCSPPRSRPGRHAPGGCKVTARALDRRSRLARRPAQPTRFRYRQAAPDCPPQRASASQHPVSSELVARGLLLLLARDHPPIGRVRNTARRVQLIRPDVRGARTAGRIRRSRASWSGPRAGRASPRRGKQQRARCARPCSRLRARRGTARGVSPARRSRDSRQSPAARS